MNEQENDKPSQSAEWTSPPRQSPTLEGLHLISEDPELVQRWEEGLTRWGWTFAAYTRIGSRQLHTLDVLSHFSDSFIASYRNIDEFIQGELISLQWKAGLERFKSENSIPPEVLHWDFDAMEVLVRSMFHLVEENGRIYAFV